MYHQIPLNLSQVLHVYKYYGSLFSFRMQHQIVHGLKKGIWKISTPETKILIVLCYYFLFGVVSLSYFSIESANREDYLLAIQRYFICEAAGSGTECDRSGFDNFGYRWVGSLVFLMLGLIPAVNLTFVINWTVAKELCKNLWMKYFQKISSSQAKVATQEQTTSDTVEAVV